ncbi:hypothetical protein [Halorussus halobius]|uniref:hypothetical protein n=1 Tax=Halorussus halobius TaxID=1710537 RepID=UPI001B2FFD6B|nr:hypothetical protein [Halorussus halobius]
MSAPSDAPDSPDPLESPAESSPELAESSPESAGPPTGPLAASSESSNSDEDPRLHEAFVRTVPAPDESRGGRVTLVGVVHDHPASAYRARTVVHQRDPEVVALEVPPVAVPLYRAYADSDSPPSFGGEMSAAAQAARESDAEVVGVDGPTTAFFARLARTCWDERISPDALRRVLSGVASVTRHAVVCRLAAAVADRTGLRVEVDDPVAHDCERTDPPAEQARDERAQARRSRSLLRAVDPPEPVELREATREACMADALADLRSRGDAVAVVGLDHLDAVADRLVEK